MKRSNLTEQDVKHMEEYPIAIEYYAAGYLEGRLHSMVRLVDCAAWAGQHLYGLAYTKGYRDGWRVEGRPV